MSAPGLESRDITELHSPEAIAHNNRAIFFCRIIVASVAGSAAGILGVTGLGGFLFYAAVTALVSLLALHHAGYSTNKYFTTPSAVWTEAVGQGLLSYVLFWTLFYGFTYIF
jgi:membrane protein DedA with SNARE-associated domain